MTTTPETDAELLRILMDRGVVDHRNAPENLVSRSRQLETERDAARELCRWAFPRLRAMCHDFGATTTGWECAEKMEAQPDIFTP